MARPRPHDDERHRAPAAAGRGDGRSSASARRGDCGKGKGKDCGLPVIYEAFRWQGLNLASLDAGLGRYFGTAEGRAGAEQRRGPQGPAVRRRASSASAARAVDSPRDVMRALRDKDAGSQLKFDADARQAHAGGVGDGAEVASAALHARRRRRRPPRRARRRRCRPCRRRAARAAPPAPPRHRAAAAAAARRRDLDASAGGDRAQCRTMTRCQHRGGSDRAARALDCDSCASAGAGDRAGVFFGSPTGEWKRCCCPR